MSRRSKKTSSTNENGPPSQLMGDMVAWVTWLYYVEGETQEVAAKRLGVSRGTVVNYLNEAKERGLVKINVDPRLLSENALCKALREKYALVDALVIPKTDLDAHEPGRLRRRAGEAGARILRSLLQEGETLGVAWGRTMLEVGRALPREPIPNVTVLQVAGSMLNEEHSSPEFCTAMIANRLGAKSLNFHAPAVVSSRALRDSLMQEPSLARYRQRLKTCDVMMFGVGAVDEATLLGDLNFSDHDMINAYASQGAEAIVVGRFIDRTGAEVLGPLTGRRIAISLEDLMRAPKRLLVASGEKKAKAIRAMLTGKYCTHLVVDFDTGVRLAEM